MGITTTTRRTPRAPAHASDVCLADDLMSSIYRPTMARLVAYFRNKGMSAEEAVDLAQETVLRMLVHLRRHGRSAEDLRPLTKTIARNLLVERLRKPGTNIVSLTAADEIEAVEEGPDEHVETVERRRAVHAALRSLSPRHRRVVELWLEGRTAVEIGRELGIKRNAVDAVLHRARRALASRLGPRALWGLVALAFIRFRLAARDAANAAASWSPGSASAAPAAVSLATFGLAAVVSVVGSTPGAASTIDVAKTPVAKVAPAVAARTTVAPAGPNASEAAATTGVVPSTPPKYVWSAGIDNPASDSKEDVGVDITYEPDKYGRGAIDSVLVPILEHGCTSATSCIEGER